jgi:hypothetical protein
MPSAKFRTASICAAALAAAVLPGSAAVQAPLYRGEYTLSFLGLTVAEIDLRSRIDSNSYAIEGEASSAGLGAFFYDTYGKLTASGSFAGGIKADHFRAEYRYAKKPTLVDIRFAGGDVVKVVNDPPLKKRGKNWVPIKPADLKQAVDPIAATLVKADRLDDVCKGGARMFDGELRADLTLSYEKKGEISFEGFEGPTVTCRLKFTPAAGYRKGRRALEFLRTKSRIMVTFAEIRKTGVYAPVHATIGTEIGTITVRARRFQAL